MQVKGQFKGPKFMEHECTASRNGEECILLLAVGLSTCLYEVQSFST